MHHAPFSVESNTFVVFLGGRDSPGNVYHKQRRPGLFPFPSPPYTDTCPFIGDQSLQFCGHLPGFPFSARFGLWLPTQFELQSKISHKQVMLTPYSSTADWFSWGFITFGRERPSNEQGLIRMGSTLRLLFLRTTKTGPETRAVSSSGACFGEKPIAFGSVAKKEKKECKTVPVFLSPNTRGFPLFSPNKSNNTNPMTHTARDFSRAWRTFGALFASHGRPLLVDHALPEAAPASTRRLMRRWLLAPRSQDTVPLAGSGQMYRGLESPSTFVRRYVDSRPILRYLELGGGGGVLIGIAPSRVLARCVAFCCLCKQKAICFALPCQGIGPH